MNSPLILSLTPRRATGAAEETSISPLIASSVAPVWVVRVPPLPVNATFRVKPISAGTPLLPTAKFTLPTHAPLAVLFTSGPPTFVPRKSPAKYLLPKEKSLGGPNDRLVNATPLFSSPCNVILYCTGYVKARKSKPSSPACAKPASCLFVVPIGIPPSGLIPGTLSVQTPIGVLFLFPSHPVRVPTASAGHSAARKSVHPAASGLSSHTASRA